MKKNIAYIVSVVIVLVALIAMLIFVFSKNSEENDDNYISLIGTWEVVAVVQNDVPTFVDAEFMIFDENSVSNYRDGNQEPFASSSYEISLDNKLVLPDISRNYIVDIQTNNCIRLYETAEKYLILIRYPNTDMSAINYDKKMLIGKWNVISRDFDEMLEFTEDILNDYRNGSTEPVSVSSYVWVEDKYIYAERWNKNFEFHFVSDTIILFIESDTGYLWELHKASDVN